MQIVNEFDLFDIMQALRGARVVSGSHSATPWALLAAAAATVETYTLFIMNAQKGPGEFNDFPNRQGVTLETAFIGPGMRGRKDIKYYPCHLSLVNELLRTQLPPNAVFVQTSRVINSKVSLGTEVNYLPAVIRMVHENGGLVFAEINEQMPYTFGDGEFYTDVIDYAIEVDRPLATHVSAAADEKSVAIAEHVASLIPDGATLQGGIGGVVDSAMARLDGYGYRIFTELATDWAMLLEKAGKLDPNSKIITTFAFGSTEFYRWLDCNDRVQFVDTEFVNAPSEIAGQDRMVSINTALKVDLFDQANASYIKGSYYSGFGGALDFTTGSTQSVEGLSILALPAWNVKHEVSNIVPRLTEPVTTMQHSYVVTEYGIAKVWGCDSDQIAENLIMIAHPTMRRSLEMSHFGNLIVSIGGQKA